MKAMMESLSCRNCGLVGTEVEPVEFPFEYVGGQGHTRTGPFCRNVVACWYRWDAGARGPAWTKAIETVEVTK